MCNKLNKVLHILCKVCEWKVYKILFNFHLRVTTTTFFKLHIITVGWCWGVSHFDSGAIFDQAFASDKIKVGKVENLHVEWLNHDLKWING